LQIIDVNTEARVDTDHYKQRLLTREQELIARIKRASANAREPDDGSPHDIGDASVLDEMKDEQLTEAEADRALLAQVRAALKRIADGTFGRCAVDGKPIEAPRLEAMPWTPYCLKHQESIEAANPPKTPSL
jgi:RNA polymerase-binding transcription factor DksA